MAADVSLVYLSTASTILYFSSCSSSSYSSSAARRPSSLSLSLSLSLSSSLFLHPSRARDLTAFSASVSSPFSHASPCRRPGYGRVSRRADAVHLFVTASLASPRRTAPRRRRQASSAYARASQTRATGENPSRNQFKIMQRVVVMVLDL